jgi:hypothetical protein
MVEDDDDKGATPQSDVNHTTLLLETIDIAEYGKLRKEGNEDSKIRPSEKENDTLLDTGEKEKVLEDQEPSHTIMVEAKVLQDPNEEKEDAAQRKTRRPEETANTDDLAKNDQARQQVEEKEDKGQELSNTTRFLDSKVFEVQKPREEEDTAQPETRRVDEKETMDAIAEDEIVGKRQVNENEDTAQWKEDRGGEDSVWQATIESRAYAMQLAKQTARQTQEAMEEARDTVSRFLVDEESSRDDSTPTGREDDNKHEQEANLEDDKSEKTQEEKEAKGSIGGDWSQGSGSMSTTSEKAKRNEITPPEEEAAPKSSPLQPSDLAAGLRVNQETIDRLNELRKLLDDVQDAESVKKPNPVKKLVTGLGNLLKKKGDTPPKAKEATQKLAQGIGGLWKNVRSVPETTGT